ncbi:MAG TPA: tetratricopeptide repeat protein [bacterium]|nr:tetratricopeptide repeat protein [bacterium]
MAPNPQAVKLHTLGNKLAEEKKYNEAISQFEKAIAMQPDYAAAHLHLAEALEAKKQDEKAYESYMRAIELNPMYATQHIDTGLDTLLSGPLGKAVAQFKKQQGLATKPGAALAGLSTREMSAAEQETAPAIKKEKQRGQAGIKPLKMLFKPGETSVSTPAGGFDWVAVEVLGAKDIPAADCPVIFKLKNGPEQADAFLGADAAAMAASSGPKELTVKTDGDGRATVYMKRAKIVGANTLEVRAEGMSPAMFVDNTHSAELAKLDIGPAESLFSTAQRVSFSFLALDAFGNRIQDLTLEIALRAKKRHEWEVVNNATLKTDAEGKATCEFEMPTRGNTKCVLEAFQKQAGFKAEKKFNVVPGKASSMMFIPARKKAVPGATYTLKLRLMDEFDNPIEGLPAAIALKESSGGDWLLDSASEEITGEDGSVTAKVTAPAEEGAEAVFEAITDALAPELKTEARAETEGGATQLGAAEETFDSGAAPSAGNVDNFDFGDEELIPVAGADIAAPAGKSSPPETFSDLDIGSDGLSGLPEISLDADAGRQDVFAPEEELRPGGIPGGAAALEGLDFDADGPAPVQAEPSFDSEPAVPTDDFVSEPAPETDDYGYGETSLEPQSEISYEEPAMEQIPEPDFTARPVISEVPDLQIHIESEEITCRAGELLPFRAKATDLKGKPISLGVTLLFSIQETSGEDSGAYFMSMSGMQGEKTSEMQPDLAGEAVASIQVPGVCGSFGVTVSAGDVSRQAIVSIAPGVPASIALKTAKTSLAAGEKTMVTATISDRHGNPAPGEFVSVALDDYTGTPGTINQGEQMSDANGEVRAVYVAAGAGSATLSASNPSVGSFAVKTVTIESVGGAAEQKPAAKKKSAPAPVPAPEPVLEQFDLSEPGGLSGEPAFEPFEFSEPGQAAAETSIDEYAAESEYEQPSDSGQGEYAEPASEYGGGEEGARPGEGEEYDEYMRSLEAADPYQPPKFEIKRGRKPVMELNTALPKMMKLGAVAVGVLAIALAILFSYKQVLYTYHYSQGRKYYAAGDMANALDFYEKAAKINEKQTDPLKRIARIRMDNAEKLAQRNQTSLAERELDMATEALNKLLAIEPNNLDALYQMGEALESKGEYCKAIESFQKLLRDVDPNYQMAQAKIEQDRGLCAQERQLKGGGARGGARRSADQ